jgi:DNA helicase TIP49 (TBP-interacting protein)
MADTNTEVLRKETYLKAIENSIGSRIFNSLFVKSKTDGKVWDVMNDGEYSCAFFVSSVLFLMQALGKSVATVDSLRKLIVGDSKWTEVDSDQVETGDVVFWDKVKYEDGSENAHVGFALSKEEAVSTDYKQKMVVRHKIGTRPITGIYRYSWHAI